LFLQDAEMLEDGIHILEVSDPSLQASLESEAPVDDMDGEQTFPTEEELAAAKGLYAVTAVYETDCMALRVNGH
jgi:hypothetical protein